MLRDSYGGYEGFQRRLRICWTQERFLTSWLFRNFFVRFIAYRRTWTTTYKTTTYTEANTIRPETSDATCGRRSGGVASTQWTSYLCVVFNSRLRGWVVAVYDQKLPWFYGPIADRNITNMKIVEYGGEDTGRWYIRTFLTIRKRTKCMESGLWI